MWHVRKRHLQCAIVAVSKVWVPVAGGKKSSNATSFCIPSHLKEACWKNSRTLSISSWTNPWSFRIRIGRLLWMGFGGPVGHEIMPVSASTGKSGQGGTISPPLQPHRWTTCRFYHLYVVLFWIWKNEKRNNKGMLFRRPKDIWRNREIAQVGRQPQTGLVDPKGQKALCWQLSLLNNRVRVQTKQSGQVMTLDQTSPQASLVPLIL